MGLARSWPPCAATRQVTHFGPIGTQQCLFLRAAPAFDLALGCNCVGYPVKVLRPNKNDWPSRISVALVCSRVVLINARTEVVSSRASDVVGSVGATKHMDIRTHRRRPSRLARARTSSDERNCAHAGMTSMRS